MSVLTINGVAVVNPTSFQWQLDDLSSDDSGEDLSGYTHKDIIRRKRHLNLEWGSLPFATAHSIIAAASGAADFDVTFPDLLTGGPITRRMYVGTRSAPFLVYNEEKGQMYVSGVSFDLIETEGDVP